MTTHATPSGYPVADQSPGANSGERPAQATNDVGGIAADQLRQFIERIERLEEEKAAIAADLKDVYAQAKSSGFDTKVMRDVVRIRKKDPHERAEHEELLDTYLAAVGY